MISLQSFVERVGNPLKDVLEGGIFPGPVDFDCSHHLLIADPVPLKHLRKEHSQLVSRTVSRKATWPGSGSQ